jgi:hypothetical protein
MIRVKRTGSYRDPASTKVKRNGTYVDPADIFVKIQGVYRSVYNAVRSLFAANEPGVWFDASDMSTMFQDAAGTTPVTAMEQPVGLWLDKSRGLVLGSELVSNPGPSFTATTGWSINSGHTLSVVGGKIRATNGAGGYATASIPFTTVVGTTYRFVYELQNTGAMRVATSASSGDIVAATIGTGSAQSVHFKATTTTTYINFYVNSGTVGVTADLSYVTIKELPGNHASQSTAASRPVLSARVNLLTRTEEFDNSAWTKDAILAFGSGSTANATTAPDGATTADLITEDLTTAAHGVRQSVAVTTGVNYTYTVRAKQAVGTRTLTLRSQYTPTGFQGATFNLSTGATSGVGTGITAASTDLGNGWWLCSISFASSGTGSGVFYVNITSAGTVSYAGDGASSIYIWGADLRLTADATAAIPAYQRVVTATDYDTSGFPHYLRFDGVDDSLSTGSINFTSTDKMTVFAGVTKLSDAVRGAIVELSGDVSALNGAFLVDGPGLTPASDHYRFVSKGTAVAVASTGAAYPAPTTSVLAATSDISGDSTILRINGTQAASSTADLGTGNYGNYPLYIGRRGGTTLPFNGRLASLVVRGAATSADQIAATERVIAGRTGVTL